MHRVRLALAGLAGTLLALLAGGLATVPDLPAAQAAEFSSAGSADFHAFDHAPDGVTHVLFLEARWSPRDLGELRDRAQAWRQAVTLDLPGGGDVVLQHWAGDLPDAAVEVRRESGGSLTISVTSLAPHRLRAGRLYRTQVLVRADASLDGVAWSYREQLDGDSTGAFEADAASAPRAGTTGWCSDCYVVWGALDS